MWKILKAIYERRQNFYCWLQNRVWLIYVLLLRWRINILAALEIILLLRLKLELCSHTFATVTVAWRIFSSMNCCYEWYSMELRSFFPLKSCIIFLCIDCDFWKCTKTLSCALIPLVIDITEFWSWVYIESCYPVCWFHHLHCFLLEDLVLNFFSLKLLRIEAAILLLYLFKTWSCIVHLGRDCRPARLLFFSLSYQVYYCKLHKEL